MSWVRSLPRWWLVLTVAMALGGAGVIVTGVVVDGTGWWAERPFTTNVISALASALVGIPTSVLVIAVVLDRVRERRITHEVQTAGVAAVQDISTRTSLMLVSHASTATVEEVMEAAEAVEEFLHRRDSLRGPESVRDAAALVEECAPDTRMWRHWAEEITAASADLARARRLATGTALDFPDQATEALLRQVAALITGEDEPFPAAYSYSGKVDAARLVLSVRAAAMNWLTEAGRTWRDLPKRP